MSEGPTERIVLTPDVRRGDVATVAWDLGFLTTRTVDDLDEQPEEEIWRAPDGSTTLHLIEDHFTGLRYAVVRGENLDATVRKVRKQVGNVTHVEALRALKEATTFEDKLLALYQLGAAAPKRVNSRVAAAFRRMLRDENPDLRHAALVALAYSGWPEMKDDVRRMAEEDPSSTIREAAGRVLADYE